jgi:hypothetical protein
LQRILLLVGAIEVVKPTFVCNAFCMGLWSPKLIGHWNYIDPYWLIAWLIDTPCGFCGGCLAACWFLCLHCVLQVGSSLTWPSGWASTGHPLLVLDYYGQLCKVFWVASKHYICTTSSGLDSGRC